MKYRILGNNLRVSSFGLGCMGMSEFYGSIDRSQVVSTLKRALGLGIDFFDTADVYGYGDNEELVGEALIDNRKDIVIATKFGIVRSRTDASARGVNGSPKYIKAACEASLKRLKTDYIDLYYMHRLDPNIPIEVSVGAMAELVAEGKVRHIGLSEVDADTLRRAHSVHPITAIQTEYSLWSRGVETNGILDVCKELGIGFVAYSPLGRGFLTSKIRDIDSLASDDFRKSLPRFQDANIKHNLKFIELLDKMAEKKNCTTAQLSLAWLLAKNDSIVPIPGTKRRTYLEENVSTIDTVELTDEEVEELDTISKSLSPKGERYTPAAMKAYSLKE